MARQEGNTRKNTSSRRLRFAGWLAAFTVAAALLADAAGAGFDGAAQQAEPAASATERGSLGRSLAASGAATAKPKVDAGASGSGTLAAGAEKSSFLDEVLPTGAALGATLLVIVLARSAAKRLGGVAGRAPRPSGVVEVLARFPVARGQQVVLLKVARRVIVVHQGAQGMQTLSVFESADEVADVISRCEAGSRNTREFSFDSVLRASGKAFEPKAATRGREADLFAGAEIETVDLTRRGRSGGRR